MASIEDVPPVIFHALHAPPHIVRAGGATATVVASGLSGGDVAGIGGTAIGAVVGVIMLVITVKANNRARLKENANELKDAKLDGAREQDAILRPWLDFYKEAYEAGHHSAPAQAPAVLPAPPPPPVAPPNPPDPEPEPI